jgi:hypothetical protein
MYINSYPLESRFPIFRRYIHHKMKIGSHEALIVGERIEQPDYSLIEFLTIDNACVHEIHFMALKGIPR